MKDLKKRFFSVLILAGAFLTARGQKTESWAFDSRPLGERRSSFNRVTIVDQRPDTTIGIGARANGLGKEIHYRPPADLQSLFLTYPLQGVPAAGTGTRELLVVVRDFWVGNNIQGMGVSAVTFSGDLFLSTGHDSFVLLQVIDTLSEFIPGRMAGRHDVIDDIFRTAMQRIPRSGAPLYDRAGAAGRFAAARARHPLYRTDSFRTGVYVSDTDFLMHRPLPNAFKQKDYYPGGTGANRPSFKLREGYGRKGGALSHHDYFALYNGKRWYLAHRDGAIAMNWDGRDFLVGMPQRGLVNMNQNGGAFFLPVGGLIGGAIAGAAAGALSAATGGLGGRGDASYVFRFNPEQGLFKPIRRID